MILLFVHLFDSKSKSPPGVEIRPANVSESSRRGFSISSSKNISLIEKYSTKRAASCHLISIPQTFLLPPNPINTLATDVWLWLKTPKLINLVIIIRVDSVIICLLIYCSLFGSRSSYSDRFSMGRRASSVTRISTSLSVYCNTLSLSSDSEVFCVLFRSPVL